MLACVWNLVGILVIYIKKEEKKEDKFINFLNKIKDKQELIETEEENKSTTFFSMQIFFFFKLLYLFSKKVNK